MTSDFVVSKCRAFLGKRYDMTERNKSEFDKRLETVTDTNHQTVALVKHILHTVRDFRITEERVDELCRTLGFITAAETAGDSDYLRIVNELCELVHAVLNIRRGKVLDNENIALCAVILKRASHIIFAVRAGEYGNKNTRRCDFR